MDPKMEMFMHNIAYEIHTLKISQQKQYQRIQLLTEQNMAYHQKMIELDNYMKLQAAEIAELRGQLMQKEVELTNAKMEIGSLHNVLAVCKIKEFENTEECCCLRFIKSFCCGFGYKENTLHDDFYYRGNL